MQLTPTFSRDDLAKLQLPVIVEGYDKVKENGSKRREYLAEFDAKERNYISAMYPKMYRWYLVTGFPEKYHFSDIRNVHLLKRACAFFAGL